MNFNHQACDQECLKRHLRTKTGQFKARSAILYQNLTHKNQTHQIQNEQDENYDQNKSFESVYYQKELLINRQFYINQVNIKEQKIKQLQKMLDEAKTHIYYSPSQQKFPKNNLNELFYDSMLTPPKPLSSKQSNDDFSGSKGKDRKSTDFRLQIERIRQQAKQQKDFQIKEIKRKHDAQIKNLYATVKQMSNQKLNYLSFTKKIEDLNQELSSAKSQLSLAKKNVIKKIEEIRKKDEEIQRLKNYQQSHSQEMKLVRQWEQMKSLHFENNEVKSILKDYESRIAQSNQQKKELVLRYEQYIESIKKSFEQLKNERNIKIQQTYDEAVKYKELAQQLQKQNCRLRKQIQKIHEDYHNQIRGLKQEEQNFLQKYEKLLFQSRKAIESLEVNSFYVAQTIYESFNNIQSFKCYFQASNKSTTALNNLNYHDIGKIIKQASDKISIYQLTIQSLRSENVLKDQKMNNQEEQILILEQKLQQLQKNRQIERNQLNLQNEQLKLKIQQFDKQNSEDLTEKYEQEDEKRKLQIKVIELEKLIQNNQMQKRQSSQSIKNLTNLKDQLQEVISLNEENYKRALKLKIKNQEQMNQLIQSYAIKLKQQQDRKINYENKLQILQTNQKKINENKQALQLQLQNLNQNLQQNQKKNLQIYQKLQQSQKLVSKLQKEKIYFEQQAKKYCQNLIKNQSTNFSQKIHQNLLIKFLTFQTKIYNLNQKQTQIISKINNGKNGIKQINLNQSTDQLVQKYISAKNYIGELEFKNHVLTVRIQEFQNLSSQQNNEKLIQEKSCKQKLDNQQILNLQILLNECQTRIKEFSQVEIFYKNVLGHLKLQIETHQETFRNKSVENSKILCNRIQNTLRKANFSQKGYKQEIFDIKQKQSKELKKENTQLLNLMREFGYKREQNYNLNSKFKLSQRMKDLKRQFELNKKKNTFFEVIDPQYQITQMEDQIDNSDLNNSQQIKEYINQDIQQNLKEKFGDQKQFQEIEIQYQNFIPQENISIHAMDKKQKQILNQEKKYMKVNNYNGFFQDFQYMKSKQDKGDSFEKSLLKKQQKQQKLIELKLKDQIVTLEQDHDNNQAEKSDQEDSQLKISTNNYQMKEQFQVNNIEIENQVTYQNLQQNNQDKNEEQLKEDQLSKGIIIKQKTQDEKSQDDTKKQKKNRKKSKKKTNRRR